MKLGDICSAPCFPQASGFDIPAPGECRQADLHFGRDGERDFYAVLLRNHPPEALETLDPRVAIVGLSPAGNQIAAFADHYRQTGNYGAASMAGAFAGLAGDIIGMLSGLGATAKLGLAFPNPRSLAGHLEVYVTSLVACATLGLDSNSNDFDPARYPAASRCVTHRFVAEILSPQFSRLSHIFVLGAKAWPTLTALVMPDGRTVMSHLRSRGKTVLNLPHPSGQNQEYVKLASMPADQVPTLDRYIAERWEVYRAAPARTGRGKENEAAYKAKRRTVWQSVQRLRDEIAQAGA